MFHKILPQSNFYCFDISLTTLTMQVKKLSPLLLLLWTNVSISKKQKSFEILKFESCPEFQYLPMVMKSKRMRSGSSNRSQEICLTVARKIGGKLEGTVSLLKCDSNGSPDSCEYYVKDYKVKKFCEVMSSKHQAWSEPFDGFKPPLRCPLEPECYRSEYPINEGVFKFFPVPPGIWKARGFLYSDDQTVLCLDFHGKVIERRT